MGALKAQMIDLLGYDPDEPDRVRPGVDEVRVAPGAMRPARDARGRDVAVARLASGKLVVVEDACPHDGGPISDGFVEGELLVCKRHGWELAPGRAAGEPCRRVCKLRE